MLLGFHLSPNVLGAEIRGKLVPSLGSVKEAWSATHTPPEHLFPVLCSYCALNGATNIHCQVPIKQHQPRPPHLHSVVGWGCFFTDPTHTTSGGQRWPMLCLRPLRDHTLQSPLLPPGLALDGHARHPGITPPAPVPGTRQPPTCPQLSSPRPLLRLPGHSRSLLLRHPASGTP